MSDELTPLDVAHMAADAEPEDDAARLRFYGVLAESELFVLLKADAPADDAEEMVPAVFALEEGRFAMAFDREERLAEFAGGAAPYAALPGRVLVRELAGTDTGIGVNLGVSASGALLPPDVLDWLAAMLAQEPDAPPDRPLGLEPPDAAALALAGAVTGAAAMIAQHANAAVFVTAVYMTGRRPALAVIGAPDRTQAAMARAVNDALAFSGLPAAALDVMFLAAGNMMAESAMSVGLPVALAEPEPEVATPATAPGMDPSRPPRLR
jgi:SseB protein N-terminal domain